MFVFLRNISFVAFFVILKLYDDAITRYRLEKEKLLLLHEKRRIELDNLKSKIAPHFLFNNLNNLYHKVVALSEPASEQIQATSALLREIFEEVDATLVPLKKEIDFINNLILLEKDERFTNLEITFSGIGKEHEEILIAPLLFEAFVSNAFKYVKRENGYIVIDLKVEEQNTLHFNCENNTEARPMPVVSTKNGLLNIRKRLDLLYPNKNRLEIHTGEHFFRVDLTVKL